MSNLEQSIAEWRRQMIMAGIQSPVPLDELENHLREDIHNQIRSGATAEDAFATAAKRIGDVHGLKQEFEKISKDPAKRKRLVAISVIAGTAFAYAVVFSTWILAQRAGKGEVTTTGVLLLLGSMATTLFFGFTGRGVAKFLPIVTNQYLQAIAITAAIFLGAGLLRVVWSILSLDSLIHAQMILLWTMSPILGFGHCLSEWCDRCDEPAGSPHIRPARPAWDENSES